MDIPWIPGGKRTVAALAFAIACFLALMYFKGVLAPVPVPPPPTAVEAPAPVAEQTKQPARTLLAAAPGLPAKVRVSPLRDKGEALGGTAPDSNDKR